MPVGKVIVLGQSADQSSEDTPLGFEVIRESAQKLHTINHRWNPNTLVYEVETTAGGTAQHVIIDNPDSINRVVVVSSVCATDPCAVDGGSALSGQTLGCASPCVSDLWQNVLNNPWSATRNPWS